MYWGSLVNPNVQILEYLLQIISIFTSIRNCHRRCTISLRSNKINSCLGFKSHSPKGIISVCFRMDKYRTSKGRGDQKQCVKIKGHCFMWFSMVLFDPNDFSVVVTIKHETIFGHYSGALVRFSFL